MPVNPNPFRSLADLVIEAEMASEEERVAVPAIMMYFSMKARDEIKNEIKKRGFEANSAHKHFQTVYADLYKAARSANEYKGHSVPDDGIIVSDTADAMDLPMEIYLYLHELSMDKENELNRVQGRLGKRVIGAYYQAMAAEKLRGTETQSMLIATCVVFATIIANMAQNQGKPGFRRSTGEKMLAQLTNDFEELAEQIDEESS